MRIALAQLNLFVGDVAGNAQRVIDTAAEARDRLNADLVLFPELSAVRLSARGSAVPQRLAPPGRRRARARAQRGAAASTVMVGYPEYTDDAIYNAAALIRDGRCVANYRKQELPNYRVFDEKRYFKPGQESCIVELERHSRRDADLRGRLGAEARARRAGRRRAAARRHQRLAVLAAAISGVAKTSCASACRTPACRSCT